MTSARNHRFWNHVVESPFWHRPGGIASRTMPFMVRFLPNGSIAACWQRFKLLLDFLISLVPPLSPLTVLHNTTCWRCLQCCILLMVDCCWHKNNLLPLGIAAGLPLATLCAMGWLLYLNLFSLAVATVAACSAAQWCCPCRHPSTVPPPFPQILVARLA